MTPEQKARTEQMMAGYADEEVTVQCIKDTLYVFGSELACLRIYHRYRYCNGIYCEYSTNLKTWFFSMPFGTSNVNPEKRLMLNEGHARELIDGKTIVIDNVALVLTENGLNFMRRRND